MIYAGLGDNECALRYLDEARRETDALDLKMQFAWQSLRSDARFQALLRRSGLLANPGLTANLTARRQSRLAKPAKSQLAKINI